MKAALLILTLLLSGCTTLHTQPISKESSSKISVAMSEIQDAVRYMVFLPTK